MILGSQIGELVKSVDELSEFEVELMLVIFESYIFVSELIEFGDELWYVGLSIFEVFLEPAHILLETILLSVFLNDLLVVLYVKLVVN